tara:strand:- start:13 stop:189 length:177 start_codon:yes stop_codon:yes gene_type:complete
MVAVARKRGLEPVPGRKLTPEEQAYQAQQQRDVYKFIEELRRFEKDSRKRSIHASCAA